MGSLAALRKNLRRLKTVSEKPSRAASAMTATSTKAASKLKKDVYEQLLGLFASDHKPIGAVRPETVLGEAYPLGYTPGSLSNFYAYKVDPWFVVTITTGKVGPNKTVEDLVDAIISGGGKPR